MAPPGSRAIDAGDSGHAPEWEQRGSGYPRIVNGIIDIGAFEMEATGAPETNNNLAVLVTADFSGSPFKKTPPAALTVKGRQFADSMGVPVEELVGGGSCY